VTGSVFNVSINASLLSSAYEVWQQYESDSFPGENNVDQYALFAFDAAWLLIQSLQRLCTTAAKKTSRPCISFVDSSFCFDRHLVNATSFFDQITSTTFVGVTGPIEYRANETDRSKGIYYLAQNSQRSSKGVSFVPVLKYSERDSWQTYKEQTNILWPDNSYVVPNDHAVLSGVTLRIGIIKSAPFAIVDHNIDELGYDKTKFIGYLPDLIELLREKMNFIPNITSTPSNTPYTKLILAVTNGDYDILIGDVTVTAQRTEIVSFSTSIFDNSLSVIIRKPVSADVDLFSYLKPFSGRLWIGILAATVYASLFICLLERRVNAALRNRSIVSAGAMSVWYSIGTIMGYGVDFQPTTASGRLLTVALYMLSLVMVATYTASLASNLTKARSQYIVNSIDDIKKGKLPSNRIGVIENTAMEQYYLREISQGSRNFYPATSRQQILGNLLGGTIDATFLDSGVAEYITNNIYCNLTVVGGTFNDGVFGIVMPKNWPYQQNLDMNILSLRESGQLDSLRKRWFQTGKCDHLDERLGAIQIESMAGLFLIFGIITALALLPLAWGKCSMIINYFQTLKTRIYGVSQEKDSSTNHSNQSSS
jgi:ABC-type amino acid transport substrate-binding protein